MPTVSLVTEQFRGLARATARGKRLPDLPVVVLPQHLDQMPEAEIRTETRRRLPEILAAVAATSAAPAVPAGVGRSEE